MTARTDLDHLTRLYRKTPKGILLLSAGALALLATGIWLTLSPTSLVSGRALPPNPETVVRESTTEPSEQIITTDQTYTVPVDQPRQLILPSLGSSMFIQQVALDSERRLVTPTNTSLAGWYTGSKKPGEFGVSIITGHTAGKHKPGGFSQLHTLQKGDPITVEFGDLTRKSFVVRDIASAPGKLASPLVFMHRPSIAQQQLNLVACSFSKKTKNCSDKVVVHAGLKTEPRNDTL